MNTANFIINDALILHDSIVIYGGKTELSQGRIGMYNRNTQKHILIETSETVKGLAISDGTLWACGDNMMFLVSKDNGNNWDPVWDPNYTFEYFWVDDRTDLKKIYASGNEVLFAIGNKHMLQGNLYYKNTSPWYPFWSSQLKMGVNDMFVVDSTQVYVAGYGSIVHAERVLNSKGTMDSIAITQNDIGGENFTGVTQGGLKTIVACSFSGNIYTKDLLDDTWKKTYSSSIKLRHIVGDTYGNLIAVGDSRYILISNNHGKDWLKVRHANARNITSLSLQDDYFWATTKNGEVIKFERVQLEK